MVVHQIPGIQQPTLLLDLLGEALNDAAAILLVEEDRLLRVAARGGVVERAGELESQRACRAGRVGRVKVQSQALTLFV